MSLWTSSPGDPSADALQDFPTDKGVLSLWRTEASSQNRVLAAMAASRDYVSIVDYCLVPEEVVTGLGIKLVPNPGETPDAEINQQHVDAVDLTSRQLGELAHACFSHGKPQRLRETQVQKLIQTSFDAGKLDTGRMKATILQKIRRE